MAYTRDEDEGIQGLYRAFAQYYEKLPPEIEALVESLAARTGLARDAEEYPTDADSLQRAAAALAIEGLDVDSPDPSQLDRFAHEHLLDPRVRELFRDGTYETEEGQRLLAETEESLEVPNEPLLYYVLGAFWGEWLCRHRGAQWNLFPPLHPLQSFSDAIEQGTMLLALPFSHVVKKLAAPEADMLGPKAGLLAGMVTFPPLALAASMLDGEPAMAAHLPDALEEAETLLAEGKTDEAFALLADAMVAHADNGHFLHRVEQLGWQHAQYPLVHHCSRLEVQLAPHNPRILHNFAVIESMREGGLDNAVEILFRAIELDSGYNRARLTLASCLKEAERLDEAREHAQYVAENDEELAGPATELLKEIDAAR